MTAPQVKDIHVETVVWMQEVTSVDNKHAFILGHIKGMPGFMAVSMRPDGATRFYCLKHKQIFHPINSCPDCDLNPISA